MFFFSTKLNNIYISRIMLKIIAHYICIQCSVSKWQIIDSIYESIRSRIYVFHIIILLTLSFLLSQFHNYITSP